jgi:HD-like signal output (HDOD) protein
MIPNVELSSLELRLSRTENLPVLPQAASAVLRLADDPDANQRDIAGAIERDPAVTAKLLRVANSAYYGAQNVTSVGRAISFLGINCVRSIVVSAAMQQMVSGRSACLGFNRLDHWRHSLATATASRILSRLKAPDRTEQLYCAGMLHDIGLLALERFMPEELSRAIALAKRDNVRLIEVEHETIGFDHATLGGILARKWGLSDLVHDGIAFHHEPMGSEQYFVETCIVALADTMAHIVGFCNNQPEAVKEIDDSLAAVVGLPSGQYDIIQQVVLEEVERAEQAFKIA